MAKDFVYWNSDYNEKFIVKSGDILLTLSGSFRITEWQGENALLNQRILKLTPSKNINPKFFLYYLRTQLSKIEQLGRYALVNNVSVSDIRKIAIPLPPLPEQKRIAAILDAADALRTQRRQSIAELDLLLQSTFLEMFGDPVDNPKGWKNQTLNDILSVKSINGAYYPKEYYSENGTLMVHMSDAFYGTADTRNMKRVNVSENDIKKYGLCSTDLLISRRSLNYEGSAKPCFIPKINESIIFESSLIRLRPDLKKVYTEYLFYYLANDRAREKHVFPLVTKSTISGISQSNLMKVKVIVPPLELQKKFVEIAEAIEAQKTRLQAHLTELDTLFASLQQRAFNGEL